MRNHHLRGKVGYDTIFPSARELARIIVCSVRENLQIPSTYAHVPVLVFSSELWNNDEFCGDSAPFFPQLHESAVLRDKPYRGSTDVWRDGLPAKKTVTHPKERNGGLASDMDELSRLLTGVLSCILHPFCFVPTCLCDRSLELSNTVISRTIQVTPSLLLRTTPLFCGVHT